MVKKVQPITRNQQKRLIQKERGKRIMRLRATNGISQLELGHRIGNSQAYVSDLERGVRYASLDQIFKIANALGCRASEIAPEIREF